MRAAVLPLLAVLLSCSRRSASPPPEPDDREAPATQVTSGRGGADRDPETSPDGRQIFYASSAFGRDFDLFVKPVGGNSATRLTSWPGDERFPKLNPADPRMLAFCANGREGTWEICLLPDHAADPSRIVVVSEPGVHSIHPSWSPDGRRLVWCASTDPSRDEWSLRIKDFDSGRTHVLEDIDGLLPEWSPASDRIVFQRMRRRDGWMSGLWTLGWDRDRVRDVTAVFASDEWAAINPAWSPDGSRIVFATVGKSRSRRDVLDEGDDLWTIDADGGSPTRLTSSLEADWMPTWSRDGRIYFASRRSGVERLWSLVPKAAARP
jgi:Tol biopolymer transport system component